MKHAERIAEIRERRRRFDVIDGQWLASADIPYLLARDELTTRLVEAAKVRRRFTLGYASADDLSAATTKENKALVDIEALEKKGD